MWLSRLLVVLIVFARCIPAEAQQPGESPTDRIPNGDLPFR